MLAYRHAFHAGNHADVLKHITLMLVLRYMNQKDKSYRMIDTHAGAGGYSLEGQYAQKKGEYLQGVARLWSRDDLPEAVADYMALVRQFNPDGMLEQYPGSPAIAQMMLRSQDQLRLFERHPTDHRILEAYLGGVRGARQARPPTNPPCPQPPRHSGPDQRHRLGAVASPGDGREGAGGEGSPRLGRVPGRPRSPPPTGAPPPTPPTHPSGSMDAPVSAGDRVVFISTLHGG